MTECDIRIDPRYRLEKIKGNTMFATQIATGIPVVLKPAAQFQDDRVIRHLSHIRHPAIPRVLDEIPVSDGINDRMYLVMEYLEGETFAEWLAMAGGRLAADQLIPQFARIARTIAFLHEQNDPPLLHLDLKPEHLVRLTDGSVGVIDFDCARLAPVRMTDAASIRCTIGYAAPELMAGQPSAQTDLYALGATMLVLLTGHTLATAALPPLEPLCRHLPATVVDILQSCLSADPASRFPSASALACALERLSKTNMSGELPFQTVDEGIESVPTLKTAQTVPERPKKRPYQLVAVWDHAQFAVMMATRLAEAGCQTLLIDADLLNPRADLLLKQTRDHTATGSGNSTGLSVQDQPGNGLELALTAMMQKNLEPGRFPDLMQKTSTPNLKALTGPFPLIHYDYHDANALLAVFQSARMHSDVIVVCCSRFIHDAFTCLTLLSADLGLIPTHADTGPIREFNRYLDFLSGHYPIDRKKFRFIAVDYDPNRHLSQGMTDELCGGLLAGCISGHGDPVRSSRIPLWISNLTRRPEDECDRILRRLGFPIGQLSCAS